MLRSSYAVGIAMIVAVVVCVLVVTHDLNHTNDIFTDGVVQALKVDGTTDIALTAGEQLPPADAALQVSIPQVLSIIGQLQTAEGTLGGLATQLTRAASVLSSADLPLAIIIGEVVQSNASLQAVIPSLTNINGLLGGAVSQVNTISTQLDTTLALAKNIESKLHILGVLSGTV